MSSEWVVEAVIQFVKSPLWTVPINNFIDDKCIVFADDEGGEMKFEYTAIFQEFQNLVDSLLTTFIDELEVPPEEVIAVCKNRMETEAGLSKGKYVTEFIQYVTCLDDFRSFKKVMEQRNIVLEMEAAKAMHRSVAQNNHSNASATAPPSVSESDEERDIRLAIEASLAEDDLRQRTVQLEDAELQKALALSIAMEEDRARVQQASLEEASKRTAEHNDAMRIQQEQALIEAERQRKIKELEEAALERRKENLKANDTQQSPASPIQPVVYAQPQAPPPTTSAPVAAAAVPTPDVVHVSSAALASSGTENDAALAPLGARRAPFTSFRALPSIASQQPTFSELQAQHRAAAAAPDAPKSSTTIAPAQIAVNKNEPTKEQIEERAKQMREHRERLAAAKKAERAAELETYKSANTAPAQPNAVASPTTPEDETRKLTIEIARRFREDLVGESRKQ